MTELPHACTQMHHAVEDTTSPVFYSDRFRQYSIDYVDGGSSTQVITYCPFCGVELPPTLRDRWLNTVRDSGLDPWDDAHLIPAALQSDRWWRDAGL